MNEPKGVSRRTVLKSLLMAPVMIPFEADAQTIYNAMTAELDEESSVTELIVASDIIPFSQGSHIADAFSELYTPFMTANTVIDELRQRKRILPIGSQKVRDENLTYDSRKVHQCYQDVTTVYPNSEQQSLLQMINQSRSLGYWANIAYQKPRALGHGIYGSVFYHQADRRGSLSADPEFVKVSGHDGFHHVGLITSFFVTALIDLGINYLLNKRQKHQKVLDDAVVWREDRGLYRDCNVPVWHDTACQVEKVSTSSQESINFGIPYGRKYVDRSNPSVGNVTINIYWYPGARGQTQMGDAPRQKLYHDQHGRLQVAGLDTRVRQPLNIVTYQDRRGGTYLRFFNKAYI